MKRISLQVIALLLVSGLVQVPSSVWAHHRDDHRPGPAPTTSPSIEPTPTGTPTAEPTPSISPSAEPIPTVPDWWDECIAGGGVIFYQPYAGTPGIICYRCSPGLWPSILWWYLHEVIRTQGAGYWTCRDV